MGSLIFGEEKFHFVPSSRRDSRPTLFSLLSLSSFSHILRLSLRRDCLAQIDSFRIPKLYRTKKLSKHPFTTVI